MAHLVIHGRLEGQLLRVRDLVLGDDAGTEGRKGVKRLSTAPLVAAEALLPVTGGHVIAAGVAEDIVHGILARGILARLAENDHEFSLIIDLGAGETGGDENRV